MCVAEPTVRRFTSTPVLLLDQLPLLVFSRMGKLTEEVYSVKYRGLFLPVPAADARGRRESLSTAPPLLFFRSAVVT